MIQLSRQPYQRNFIFPLISYTNLFRIIAYVIALIAPFFIVYATNSFYQTSYVSIQQPTFAFTSQYSVIIMYPIQQIQYKLRKLSLWKFLSIVYEQHKTFNIFNDNQQTTAQFTLNWPHSSTEKVKEVKIVLGVTYTFGATSIQGFATTQIKGYDLADATVSGRLQIKKGTQFIPYQANTILKQNLYSFTQTTKLLQKQPTYLQYEHTVLPVSYSNNQLLVRVVMNKKSIFALDNTPSILGQLVWSWIQYCPIMIVFVWLVNEMLSIMMKQSIFKTTIQQDKQYMAQVCKLKHRGKPKQKIHKC